ncbi:MAG: spermidine/putrescine ABC transporter permease PotC [Phototrophicales bacterium]|nr:MAG: spermidine/putrescine ABC transporter permease PotC [Phototrophicales bacterium]RMG70058.1 MAG: ABC transporter permease [Chloroflexota bacterium]
MANEVLNRTWVGTRATVISQQSPFSFFSNLIARISFYVMAVGGFIFLWTPIILLVIFSFNDSRAVNEWHGFTTRWYQNIFNDVVGVDSARFTTELMIAAVKNSLLVSLTATLIATVLGTMIALSLARGRYPGKRIIDGVLFLPVVIPEITQGVSLAMFFVIAFEFLENLTGSRGAFGFTTIIAGHVVFNVSYVAIVVRARLADMNPSYEEAARDLGANGWQTFWYITFPQIIPGILAGGLLALTLSLDDYVVTFFNSGVGTTTLPMFVYGMLKTSVTPEINAISTLMLLVSFCLVVVSLRFQRLR